MERVTISVATDLLAAFDAHGRRHGYTNRSEAMRDLLRRALTDAHLRDAPDTPCVASLVYVYDHQQRDLARRLVTAQHARHDLGVATLHVHIDAERCLETVVLRGSAQEVQAFADAVLAQPGVWSGHLHVVPLTAGAGAGEAGAPD